MFVEVKFFPRIRRALKRGGDNLVRLLSDPDVRERLTELDSHLSVSNAPLAKALLQGLNASAQALESCGAITVRGLGVDMARASSICPEFGEDLERFRAKVGDGHDAAVYRSFASGWLAHVMRSNPVFNADKAPSCSDFLGEEAADSGNEPAQRETLALNEIRDVLGSWDYTAPEVRWQLRRRIVESLRFAGWIAGPGDVQKHEVPRGDVLAQDSVPLGSVDRQRDGSLVILGLRSSDRLFDLGAFVGDVVLTLDDVPASAIPDDLIEAGGVLATRTVVSRKGELIALPDGEYGGHPDESIRGQRLNAYMDLSMGLIRQDPHAFMTANRNAGSPPAARDGMAQPDITFTSNTTAA